LNFLGPKLAFSIDDQHTAHTLLRIIGGANSTINPKVFVLEVFCNNPMMKWA
jgi:hypothetical protein